MEVSVWAPLSPPTPSPGWLFTPSSELPPTNAASVVASAEADPCPPPSSTEPSISPSEHATLPVEGSLTLQCNLTSSHRTIDESFWMKNGEEIPETRTKNKNTEYRCVCVPVHVCVSFSSEECFTLLFEMWQCFISFTLHLNTTVETFEEIAMLEKMKQ